MMEAYRQGFLSKCAEYGVDGRDLLNKKAQATDRDRVFGDAAKYYSLENPKGRDIEHVKGVLRNALRLKGGRLNDLEHATLSWHDVGVQESRPRHGEIGATMLSKKFPEYGFTPKQILQASDAVRYHSKNTRPEEVQKEMMAGKRPLLQLLAEADEGPPMSADEEVADWVKGWADGRSPQPFDTPDEAVAERTMRMLRQKAHDLKAGRLSYSTDRYNRVFKKDIDDFAKGMRYMRMKRVVEAVRKARANALAPGYVKAASKKEDYQSGYGKVESYTKDKTKDHDEIIVRTKDGRRVVVSNNTRLGKRVEPKKGDSFGYHGYVVRGTNVVHKVHPNKRQPGGWLEHVKAAQEYDEKKWPDYEEYVKEHPDKKIELVERLVREHYAKQRPWGMKTESGHFVPKDKVTRKAILNAIVRGGDGILRQRRGMCHELAAARMKMLGDNGVEGHRAFAFWGEPATKQAPDGDWLLGHSMVFFNGDDGKMHFASPKMRDKPRKNFGRFDDLKDAIRQYIAAIKDSGGLRDDDFVRIYDTTDVKFPDRIKYLDYVDRAKTGPVLYEQAADREFV